VVAGDVVFRERPERWTGERRAEALRLSRLIGWFRQRGLRGNPVHANRVQFVALGVLGRPSCGWYGHRFEARIDTHASLPPHDPSHRKSTAQPSQSPQSESPHTLGHSLRSPRRPPTGGVIQTTRSRSFPHLSHNVEPARPVHVKPSFHLDDEDKGGMKCAAGLRYLRRQGETGKWHRFGIMVNVRGLGWSKTQ